MQGTRINAGSRPSVSVVLATYNGERFLHQQLESLLTQTYPPIEIIIADDGSTDATMSIARAFEARTPIKITWFTNPRNMGFADNFLSACEKATGELIAFCDQDDVWVPEKLERCAAAFEPNTTLVVHQARLIDQSGHPTHLFRQGIRKDQKRRPLSCEPWSVFFGFSMVFRRSLLEVIDYQKRPIDYITGKHPLAHDRWVLFLASISGEVQELAETLVDYRQHELNTFGANQVAKIGSALASLPTESSRYVKAAAQFRELIESIDPTRMKSFPLFDARASAEFWRRAERQQLLRSRIYSAPRRATGLGYWASNLLSGTYKSVHTRKTRFRAILKDAAFLFRITHA